MAREKIVNCSREIDWQEPQLLQRIEDLAALGLNQEQIVCRLGIVFNQTISEIPELVKAIKKGQARGIEIAASNLRSRVLEGEVSACTFYLKAKAGWSEKTVEKELKLTKERVAILYKLCETILSSPDEQMAQAKALVSLHLDQIFMSTGRALDDDRDELLAIADNLSRFNSPAQG